MAGLHKTVRMGLRMREKKTNSRSLMFIELSTGFCEAIGWKRKENQVQVLGLSKVVCLKFEGGTRSIANVLVVHSLYTIFFFCECSDNIRGFI